MNLTVPFSVFTNVMKIILFISFLFISTFYAFGQNQIYYSQYDFSTNPPTGPYIIKINPIDGVKDTVTTLSVFPTMSLETGNEEGTEFLYMGGNSNQPITYKRYNTVTNQYSLDLTTAKPAGYRTPLITHIDCQDDKIYNHFGKILSASSGRQLSTRVSSTGIVSIDSFDINGNVRAGHL